MFLPIRPLTGRWPHALERRFARFFWNDPTVILDDAVSPEDFRKAMSAIHVGDTIKITGGNRHPVADDILIDNVDLDGAVIVDIGASDGSTSVDLISRLPQFGKYVIADLYFHVAVVDVGRRAVFFDHDDNWILTVGRRSLAWPAHSRLVRLLFGSTTREARRRKGSARQALLLNPSARALIRDDPRVSYQVHDVFTPWEGPAPTVIKVANLLRRLYFDDATISAGLLAILRSLDEGAYFLIVDNSRIKGMGPRSGLYRRESGRFRPVAETPDRPEIADLIEQVAVAEAAR